MDGIPATFILDKEGKIVEFFMGSKSKADFMNIINKYLK
jgi:peroxiredoxin